MTPETPMHETDPLLQPTADDGAEGSVEDDGAVDDMTLAADFMRSLAEGGRLIRYSTKDLLWEYDPGRGIWRRLDDSEMKGFNAALYGFVRDRIPSDRRAEKATPRYRSVRRLMFETLGEYHVAPGGFDADQNLICFANGVYDLERDVLLPHDPSHMISITRDYAYDPDAQCPRFMRFLDEVLVRHADPADESSSLVPDPELRTLAQWLFGYLFATHCRAERAFILHGEGRNGKSTLIRVMRQVVGEHNVCDFDVREISNPQMNLRLIGKLLAVQTELDAGSTIPDARLKALVSGEGLTAKEVYKAPVSFHPFATVVMAGNNLPTTRDRSKGFWARMVVIPFLNTFEGDAADTNLQDEFVPEMAGIFNWAIEGHRRLRQENWRFPEAAASRAATLGYRQETDSVLSWFDEAIEAAVPTVKVRIEALFDDYCEQCRRFRFAADNYIRFAKRLKQITDGHEGQPWSTVAEDGTPFSMSFHRDARMRGYVGSFRLAADR